jgi:hypothetical protein
LNPETGVLPPRHPLVYAAWKLSFAFALLMMALVSIGYALGGSWSGEASWTVRAPAQVVYAMVESPRRWQEWTPFPEVAFAYQGPDGGKGSSRSWNDPSIGTGSFTVTEATPSTSVSYLVELEDGPSTTGTFRFESIPEGTKVTWREEGDLGRNPLMGWAALSLRRKHDGELENRLRGLAEAAERQTTR